MDVVSVIDGEQIAYDLPPHKPMAAQKSIFQLALVVDGVESRIWLAAEDEDGKEYWLYHIQNAINICRQPIYAGRDEGKNDAVSWEIDESNIHVEKKVLHFFFFSSLGMVFCVAVTCTPF